MRLFKKYVYAVSSVTFDLILLRRVNAYNIHDELAKNERWTNTTWYEDGSSLDKTCDCLGRYFAILISDINYSEWSLWITVQLSGPHFSMHSGLENVFIASEKAHKHFYCRHNSDKFVQTFCLLLPASITNDFHATYCVNSLAWCNQMFLADVVYILSLRESSPA